MTKEEMKLKVHYELRNNIGAMALDKEGSVIGRHFRNIYKRIKRDKTKRYLESAEKNLNDKAKAQGYLSLYDVYYELGIDTRYYRYLIEHGLKCDVGWMMKGETNENF